MGCYPRKHLTFDLCLSPSLSMPTLSHVLPSYWYSKACRNLIIWESLPLLLIALKLNSELKKSLQTVLWKIDRLKTENEISQVPFMQENSLRNPSKTSQFSSARKTRKGGERLQQMSDPRSVLGRPEAHLYAWGTYFWEACGKNSSPKVHTPPLHGLSGLHFPGELRKVFLYRNLLLWVC